MLRLIFMCDAVGWKHLPVAGGLYDQHPDFLDAMLLMQERRGYHQDKERKEQESQAKREQAKAKQGRGRRR